MEAVTLSWPHPGVAVVAMVDREGHNTFTRALVVGLKTCFDAIADTPDAKVVVIHGYDTVFCAGGTEDELLGIADKKQKFDESGFYRMLLDCPLPVIAAMQGHALGGGLVFGLYADLVVMAQESLYSTNFMKYGFTPGMGATLVVPDKLGRVLGNEMLFTAKSYHGGRLQERGISIPVVPRAQVVEHALALAREMADKTCVSLRLLKAALSEPIRAQLPETVRQEMEMHEITFAQPGIHDRIRDRFGQ